MSPEMVQNVMATLLHGQGYAISLKTIFQNREISSVVSVEPLIDTILDSFSLALSFVNAPSLQVPPHHESSSSQRSLKKKICEVEITKHYRDDSPTPLLDDGFVWRKYGQKTIKNTPHQRCYYRCTYAKDQNCKAIKRVQKIQNNPPIYRTTYVGQHKCQAMAFAVFSETDDAPGSKMIQFGKYDHVMSQSVIPQVASVDHPNIIMEDKAINRNTNQECDVNDFLVDDDPLWAYQFPPFSPGDFMFLEDLPAS